MKRKMVDEDEKMDVEPVFNVDFSNSESFTLVQQGAEARLFSGTFLGRPVIIKERFKKTYRHPALDEFLTAERMKSELRCLERCRKIGLETPPVLFVDGINNRIFLGLIENAVTVREYLHNIKEEAGENIDHFVSETKELCLEMGKILVKIHENNIIHGDLTTSNILIKRPFKNLSNNTEGQSSQTSEASKNDQNCGPVRLVLLDFGLSHVQSTVEDKAVDLYVLEKAFISTHPGSELLFQTILHSYELNAGNKQAAKKILIKLEEVRQRGRKREMIG